MAKFQVRSVEELVFRKYPYVCPYCRKAPHKDNECKTVKGTGKTVNHAAVLEYYNSNASRRPKDLNAWQNMFNEIYPKNVDSKGAIIGLFEEVGELAEMTSVRSRFRRKIQVVMIDPVEGSIRNVGVLVGSCGRNESPFNGGGDPAQKLVASHLNVDRQCEFIYR
jgi:hypothetical protein